MNNSISTEISVEDNIIDDFHCKPILKQVDDKIYETLCFYKNIVETVPDAIIILNWDFNITFTNPAAEILLGFSEEELKGKSIFLLFDHRFIDICKRYLHNIINTGKIEYDFEMTKKDFSKVIVLFKAISFLNENKQFAGCVVTLTNITERKTEHIKSHEQEKRYKSIFESSPISIWEGDFSYVKLFIDSLKRQGITDFNDYFDKNTFELFRCIELVKIIDINQSTLNLYKCDSKEKLIKNLISIFTNDSFDIYKKLILDLCKVKDNLTIETTNKTLDGDIINISSSFNTIIGYENSLERVIVSVINITNSKNAEETLSHSVEKSQRSEKLKISILKNMSHEIRTPLNGILGFSEMIEDNTGKGDDINKWAGFIRQSGENLLNILTQILEISRIESGDVKLKNDIVNISREIEIINKNIKEKILKSGKDIIFHLIVESEIPAEIIIDRDRFIEIINNILQNAVKFTMKGDIFLRVIPKEKSILEIIVKDTGIGISEARLNSIFDLFEHEDDNISITYGGLGLGLSISKKIIELMGGKININSKKGEGTVFIIELPYLTPNKNSKKSICNFFEVKNKIKKVLIIENDMVNRIYLNNLFENMDIEFYLAEYGQEAERFFLTNNEIDLVLTDKVLVDLELNELFDKLRTIEKEQNRNKTPIILLNSEFNEIENQYNVKFDGYLEKPFNKIDFINCIDQIINN